MDKPDVDSIEGLSPAISIDQKTTSRNPRSTVGTATEINDYLRLLYARVGVPYCINGHGKIAASSVEQIVDEVLNCLNASGYKSWRRLYVRKKGNIRQFLKKFRRMAMFGSVLMEMSMMCQKFLSCQRVRHIILRL